MSDILNLAKSCQCCDARIDGVITGLIDEIERLRAIVRSCESWIERWTGHAGNCQGGEKCTCGRTLVLYEASYVRLSELDAHEQGAPPADQMCPKCRADGWPSVNWKDGKSFAYCHACGYTEQP